MNGPTLRTSVSISLLAFGTGGLGGFSSNPQSLGFGIALLFTLIPFFIMLDGILIELRKLNADERKQKHIGG